MSEQNEPTKATIEFPSVETDMVKVQKHLIINALKCIDAAAQRGAYQGGEMSAVGGVRDALYSLVEKEVEELVRRAKADAEAKASAETK